MTEEQEFFKPREGREVLEAYLNEVCIVNPDPKKIEVVKKFYEYVKISKDFTVKEMASLTCLNREYEAGRLDIFLGLDNFLKEILNGQSNTAADGDESG